MPRRYYDYVPEFHQANIISSFGAFIMIAGLAIIIINLFRSVKRGQKADANPWGGKTLEWTVSSPPIVENFEEIPEIK
jgi:cytochrome c oxidase subunit 1